ncbi:MAG: hypothetical protein WC535_08445 [Candidatus Cloacimonas sp.]
MNIKNTDSISILIANSGNQKKYHPVSELKADILADVEADAAFQDIIIQGVLSKVAAPVLTTESTIIGQDVNPAIAIEITKNTFIEGDSENAGNWIIDFGKTDLILNTIAKLSATEMRITTTGTAKVGTIRILALKACFDAPIVDSNVLEIEVPKI